MSTSPSPAPMTSASCSALGTPARMWSSTKPKPTRRMRPWTTRLLNAHPTAPKHTWKKQEREGGEVEGEGELTASQLSRLEHVLERSTLYSSILKQQMDDARVQHARERAEAAASPSKSAKSKLKAKAKAGKGKGRGRFAKRRKVVDSDDEGGAAAEEEGEGKEEQSKEGEGEEASAFPQPALVTGARMKDYQLEGLQWMVGLHEQGISGILADEMGLGKTLQTIAFAAHLRAKCTRPFLVVCPLSVLHNWCEEFKRFAPAIPVLMYYGNPADRAALRKRYLSLPDGYPLPPDPDADAPTAFFPSPAEPSSAKDATSSPAGKEKKGRGRPRKAQDEAETFMATAGGKGGRGRGRGGGRGGRGGRGGGGGWGGEGRSDKGGGERKGCSDDEGEDEDDGSDSDEDQKPLTPIQSPRAARISARNSARNDTDNSKDTSKEKPTSKGKPTSAAAPGKENFDKEKAKRQAARAALEKKHDKHFAAFPVVVTTYELVMRDRAGLGVVPWGYIVVDEGHRLKNMNCALMREIKKYSSAGRMVLTGTPLHNNLAELWSLLNFILPDIFDDVDAFQEFSLPRMADLLPSSRMGTFITKLHTILKPFLLRRVKAEVLGPLLPPKKSYVLYARLSAQQHEGYEAVLAGGARLREWVKERAEGVRAASAPSSPSKAEASPASVAAGEVAGWDDNKAEEQKDGRTLRARARRRKRGETDADRDAEEEEERRRAVEAFTRRGAEKHVNNMKLQNTVMQLRKVCSHPLLFGSAEDEMWASKSSLALPSPPRTGADSPRPVFAGRTPLTPALLAAREAELLGASGKMLLLDRLLGELFRRGHKVLLFSQFTTMLDILEVSRGSRPTRPFSPSLRVPLPFAPWLSPRTLPPPSLPALVSSPMLIIRPLQDWADMKGWHICRIDGSTSPDKRRDQMNEFQTGGDAPDAPRLFLLSTRSGGLGVNLTAADTVIFYDQDWNPQMDAQAQDRAHRIGQTKPVLIFRLVSAHTIEEKIMQKATEKRKLEALVIAKGKFKMPASEGKRTTMAEVAADLLRLEGEQIDVLPSTTQAGDANTHILSDEDLEALLDRSPEVFADRGTGWKSSEKRAAFAVFEPPPDAGSEALAGMMGEEELEE
ncbi:SNF2 family DNA-dependent ATPase [Mycena sanguinolenta]|uniref:SNF2 family DNA-dependent ATPase n=1 Tax=Mycena sanguinolenta TaxID=230812 RepID=A0A8H7CVN6_9AGAR|nr:SNF2 family DNA-dependent ATPase [Mycena sanguinolenta]